MTGLLIFGAVIVVILAAVVFVAGELETWDPDD